MYCELQYIDIGCVGHCETITIPLSIASGNYRLRYSFLDSIIQKNIQVVEDLTIDTSILPVNTELIVQILNMDGAVQPFEFEGEEYVFFKIKTVYKNEIEA